MKRLWFLLFLTLTATAFAGVSLEVELFPTDGISAVLASGFWAVAEFVLGHGLRGVCAVLGGVFLGAEVWTRLRGGRRSNAS